MRRNEARTCLRVAGLVALALIAACTARSVPAGPAEPYLPGHLPGYPRLGTALPAGATRYDNASLADLLVRLTHELEWGAQRPHLVRYERPVRVAVRGAVAGPYLSFLDRYLAALRRESGIDIARQAERANLIIRFVPGQAFRRQVPQHFCVVAPGLVGWDRFRQSPIRHGTRAYETQTAVTGMTVFIPDNAEPYVVRTCLVEEIAQALGPANDLYGLGPTIFNDDAAHVWPTRLDFLMLRVLYAPALRTGLSRAETRNRALAVLDRINPAGRGAPPLPPILSGRMAGWAEAIRTAFNRTRSMDERLDAAHRAVAIARARAPASAYHCRALSAVVRLGRARPGPALDAAREAERVCAAAHGPGDVRLARLALDKARLLYEAGNYAGAVATTEGTAEVLAAHGHAERLTALYGLRAAALRAIQQGTKSFEARRLAGEWGAYALGRNHPSVRHWQLN